MKINAVLCLFLVVVTLAVYWQTGNNSFTSFDDISYVVRNPHVASGLTGGNIAWAFTSTEAANWHPLTWLSHMADCQLFGLNPRGHHLTNVFIHTVSTLLLFLLLNRITGARAQSFVVAALFSLHPLHVESVAWISERKDLLCGLFWILTLLLYAKYVEKPGRNRYLLTIFSFVAGLMAKPMLVTLPLVMLLLDYWPLRRLRPCRQGEYTDHNDAGSASLRHLLKEKIPFLFFSVLSSIMTIYAQSAGASMASLKDIPLGLRLENAVVSYAKYITKMVLPYDLAIFYPLWPLPLWQVLGALLLLSGISVLAYQQRKRLPYLAAGWFWFLITLLPVIGIAQVGDQAMADRYTYMPLIGLFMAFSWGVSDLVEPYKNRTILFSALTGSVVIVCVVMTNQQLAYWKDDIELFSHAINVTRDNYKAHHALGVTLARDGNFEEAFPHLATAISIVPDAVIPYYDMGVALEASGRTDEALSYYRKVISMNPDHVEAHTQMGGIFCRKGEFKEAFTHLSTAINLNPDSETARFELENCRNISDKQQK